MRSISMAVLMMGVVLSGISSCSTVPKPLAPGELRLVSIQVPEKENIQVNTPFLVKINFEADGEPEIRAACFYFSGVGPHCSKVTDAIYGSLGTIQVQTRTKDSSSNYLECFVKYIRNGEIQTTNAIGINFQVAPEKGPSPGTRSFPGRGQMR